MSAVKSKDGKGAFMRICAGCGTHHDKRQMLRVSVKDGMAVFDPSGRSGGRGGYVCADPGCIAAAAKNRRLSRTLRRNVSSDVYVSLMSATESNRHE